MKLLIILSSIIIAQAAELKFQTRVIKINGVCYEREDLNDDLLRPLQFGIDRSSNTLYFTYYDTKNHTARAAKYDLNTKELTNIEGIAGSAQAVDPKTHELYLGGEDGLYKYNKNTNKAEFLGERGSKICNMYYKDTLYYTLCTSERVYTYTNGQATILEDLKDTSVRQFLIDDQDYMYYTNETGVYGQRKGTKNVFRYIRLGDEVARGLAADINGDVSVCLGDGIYALNKATKSFKNLFNRKMSYGIAFDTDNNIIFSDWSSLFKLKANKDLSC